MRVFVTGATGWVGSAVVRELIAHGHTILGLARSDEGARALAADGAEVHRGDLADVDGLRAGAAACDGVIHTAFKHDFAQFQANAETDRQVIEAMGDAIAGTGMPLVTTSGTLIAALGAAPGHVCSEEDAPDAAIPRVASELATLDLAKRGVRSSVMRLPPSVHGTGDKGFMPRIIDIARESGVAAYIGNGANRWPAVHRLDAARAYRLALEKGEAGARYHPIGDDGVAIRDLAEVIGRKLGIPTASKTPDEATGHFGFLAMFLGLDAPAASALTRQQLGWAPTQPGLLADLEDGGYFDATRSKFSSH